MCGHAACNIIPVVASNRVGKEDEDESSMTFYGSSFIADEEGNKVKELSRSEEGFIIYEFDLDAISEKRYSWGVFRGRRPSMKDKKDSLESFFVFYLAFYYVFSLFYHCY